MLAPHTILQNRYRIVRQLGQGGMGTVYEAQALRLNTKVALKETHFTDERLRKQFEREAQLLAGLRHPALPRVIDHFDEGDGLYLVMDFVEGNDLWDMIRERGGAFPLDDVLTWAEQLLGALHHLHTQSPPVIHRDIKLQNLKITGEGKIILLDFGLAKGLADPTANILTTRTVMGFSLPYAPLEQILQIDESWREHLAVTNAQEVERLRKMGTDHRSDLYSVGATLLHLLTAKIPTSSPTRAISVWSGRPDQLEAALAQGVPNSLRSLFNHAMALDPGARFSSATEMLKSLQDAAKGVKGENEELVPTLIDITLTNDAQGGGTVSVEPSDEEETHLRKAPGQAIEFTGDDDAYFQWLSENPTGYVINTARAMNPKYMVLHRATCSHISELEPELAGGFTERGYVKICAPGVEELKAWVRRHGRLDGSFSRECSTCHPRAATPPTGDERKKAKIRAERLLRFWDGLLILGEGRMPLQAKMSAPSERSYIYASAGIGGLVYAYNVFSHSSRVELYISRPNASVNKRMFDELLSHKQEIEAAFGGPLSWQRLDGKGASRIAYMMTTGGHKDDESNWRAIQSEMVEAMARLENALSPFIPALAQIKQPYS